MVHDAHVLEGRFALLAGAPDEPDSRAAAVRRLFKASGCAAIREGDPDRATDALACAFSQATQAAGLALDQTERVAEDCVAGGAGGAGPNATSRGYLDCKRGVDWSGGQEWQPFLRRGFPVFGIHSIGAQRQLGGSIDPTLYVKSYRMLAVLVALADEALPPAAIQAAARLTASSR
jgi:hypothetical protein